MFAPDVHEASVVLRPESVDALAWVSCHRCAQKFKETLRALVRAVKEGLRVLKVLGFSKRQPFDLNLIYWLPEIMSMRGARALLESKFAEIAFAMHAEAARDEMEDLAREFQRLTAMSSVETPNIDTLRGFII